MKKLLLVFALFAMIHSFAKVEGSGFSQNSLQPINDIIAKRFAGRIQSFVVNESVALYSEMSQYLAYSNFKMNKTGSIRLDDSLLYALLFNKEQLTEIEEKMVLHRKEIDEYSTTSFGGLKHGESHLRSFCFYNNHIYIMYNLMNFYGMKTMQSEVKQSTDHWEFYHAYYLVELNVNDSAFTKGRVWNLKNEVTKSDIRSGFSIFEDQPALFFRTSSEKEQRYDYIILNKIWDKKTFSAQAFPAMMSKFHSENIFYNRYTLNTSQHILINNQTREKIKIHQGSNQIPVYTGEFIPYRNIVYARLYKKTEKTYDVLKLDLSAGTKTVVKTFKDNDLYAFSPIFYIDQETNLLYILDISDTKKLLIVDFIKL